MLAEALTETLLDVEDTDDEVADGSDEDVKVDDTEAGDEEMDDPSSLLSLLCSCGFIRMGTRVASLSFFVDSS